MNPSVFYPTSPTPTITPSSSSSSISSHGEGKFGRYRLGDIPKVDAIFFAAFDNVEGPVLQYIECAEHVKDKSIYSKENFRERFQSVSGSIITKPELLNRLVKINFSDIKIMGHPTSLESEIYVRCALSFNMCFVVAKTSHVDCMYEPLVQKLAEYLVELEQQRRFISTCSELLPELMRQILNQLNSKGECILPVKDREGQILTTIYLILVPSYRGVEPPKVASYMVPMLTRAADVSLNSALVQKMDVLSQKIIPKIDGIRCVKEIAAEVSIDADLVARCVRNLYFYECVSLVPLFLYQNCYVSTEKLHNFYEDKSRIEECQKFVKIRLGNGKEEPVPKFSDIFRLYMGLTCGLTMDTWCKQWNPNKYHVDERRLIQYGMYHKFLRKLSIFPVTTVSPENQNEFTRIHSLCDGTQALEDLAVLYSVQPDELLKRLKWSGKFEFISK